MDDNTRYFDELETIYQEGELVEGVCGKALLLRDGEVAPLGVNLIDSMKAGTVEYSKPKCGNKKDEKSFHLSDVVEESAGENPADFFISFFRKRQARLRLVPPGTAWECSR